MGAIKLVFARLKASNAVLQDIVDETTVVVKEVTGKTIYSELLNTNVSAETGKTITVPKMDFRFNQSGGLPTDVFGTTVTISGTKAKQKKITFKYYKANNSTVGATETEYLYRGTGKYTVRTSWTNMIEKGGTWTAVVDSNWVVTKNTSTKRVAFIKDVTFSGGYYVSTTTAKSDVAGTKTGYTFDKWECQTSPYKNNTYSANSSWHSTNSSLGSVSTFIFYPTWTPNTYSISIDNGDGSSSTTLTGTYDVALTINNPTRDHYVFNGWTISGMDSTTHTIGTSTTTNTTASNIKATSFKNLRATDGTVKFTATWTGAPYAVTLNNQGATTTGTTSVTATYMAAMPSITVPAKTGYIFNGYFKNTGGSGTKYYTNTGASANNWDQPNASTIYAYWTPITYTIAFNGNGNTGGSTASMSGVQYGSSKALTANGFSKTGHSFSGWATTAARANSGTVDYADKASVSNLTTTNGATVTLYAVWSINSYTLTASANSGTITSASGWSISTDKTSATKSVQYNSAYGTLPTASRTGYTFVNWTNSSGTAVDKSTTMGAGNVSIKANWKVNSWSVIYNPNGGNGGTVTETKDYKDTFNLKSAITKNESSTSTTITTTLSYYSGHTSTTNEPHSANTTKTATTSYTFNMWAEDSTSGTQHAAGSQFTMPNKSVTFYALWNSTDKNPIYTSFTLPKSTRNGYTFNGWYTASGGTDKVGDGGASYTPTANKTLYAHWTPIEYTATFKPNGGTWGDSTTSDKTKNYYITDTLTAPTTISRVGYTFAGWKVTTKGGNWSQDWTSSASSTTTLTSSGMYGNVTFTAQWTVNSYSIYYNPNGGTQSGSAPTSAPYGEVINISNPTKKDFVFEGWTFNGNTSTAKYGTSSGAVTTSWSNQNTKVTAQYFKNLTPTNADTVTLTANWRPDTNCYVHVSGAWKKVNAIYVRVNGAWKSVNLNSWKARIGGSWKGGV